MVLYRRFFLSSILTLSTASAIGATGQVFAAEALPHVALTTTAGEIVLELNPDKAPKTVANFLQYVKSGYYDGTIFHRVINGFMIQGGGFDAEMKEKPTNPPIPNEGKNGVKNDAYTVAMARTSDPDSATAQFFINVNKNAMLDYPGRDNAGYAVFGKVVKGIDVVDKIKSVATSERGPHQNVPVKPVAITSARLLP